VREAEHLKWRLFHRLAHKMTAKSDRDESRSLDEIAERLRMPVTMKYNRGGKGWLSITTATKSLENILIEY